MNAALSIFQNMNRCILHLLLMFSVTGCVWERYNDSENLSRYCERNEEYREALHGAIIDAEIEIHSIDDRGCFLFNNGSGSVSAVREIADQLFGSSPPMGRSFSPNSGEVIEKLKERNIEVSHQTYRGREYIVWSYEDGEEVEKLFPPEFGAILKKQRLESIYNYSDCGHYPDMGDALKNDMADCLRRKYIRKINHAVEKRVHSSALRCSELCTVHIDQAPNGKIIRVQAVDCGSKQTELQVSSDIAKIGVLPVSPHPDLFDSQVKVEIRLLQ